MSFPGFVPNLGTALWLAPMVAGFLMLTILAIRLGPGELRTALLLLATLTLSSWLTYLVARIRFQFFPLADFAWRDDPFTSAALLWVLLFLSTSFYFLTVFVRAAIDRRQGRMLALAGLTVWVIQFVSVFYYGFRLSNAI